MFSLSVREWEWCKENPVARISIGKLNNEVDRWLRYEEEEKLLKHLPEWIKDIILFALNTGMRQNEIFTLKWSEVDLFRKTVSVLQSKNYDERTIPLNETFHNLLSRKAKIRVMSMLVLPDPKTGQKIVRQSLMWHFCNARRSCYRSCSIP